MATDNDNISSVLDYVVRVKEITCKLKGCGDDILLFRGHAKEDYELKPSLFRKGNEKIRDREAESIRRIEIAHPRELAGMSTLDKLAMLQHYEFPTRLLDFSFNPLVGLFFASNSHMKENGAVIICRVVKNEVMKFDSDVVKALASLAVFPMYLKNELSKYERHQLLLAFKQFTFSGGYVSRISYEEKIDEVLLFQARTAKHFLPPEVKGEIDLLTPIFVETKLLNPRIVSQKGAFLLFGLRDEFPAGIQREEIIIPAQYKATIISELEQFGIDDSIMFPGFEHFLLSLREKMKRGE